MTNVVAVYVGQAGLTNLEVGLSQAVWGFKQNTGEEAVARPLVLWTNDESPARIWWLAPELRLLDDNDLQSLGYPTTPKGQYLCRTLTKLMTEAPAAPGRLVGALTHRRRFGQPMATTWAALGTALP
jgi:hypothetical protein